MSSLTPQLEAEAIARNMAEIDPCLGSQEASVAAHRCLFCFDAPCIHACPTGIDVPAFIRKIATGNVAGAARTILAANVLGASCARVCPTQVLCEGACVLLDRDHDPVEIGRLQRYATDLALAEGADLDAFLPKRGRASGKKVALLGAGPASLGCAAELARLGHQAVIFERQSRPGGLNTHGIAYYKLRPEVSLREVELVQSLGVEIRCDSEVGAGVSIDDVQGEHDALFIGIGLGETRSLGLPGGGLPEVREALSFIREIRTDALHEIPVGRQVVVVGCGNTAIDVATQAKRLGAERVTIVYRRGAANMSAFEYEYELAKADGVEFIFGVLPTEVLGDGHVTGIRLVQTATDSSGKLAIVAGTECVHPCDMVVEALGQEKLQGLLVGLFPGIAFGPGGVLERDFHTGCTNLPGVFAGGDCANGGSEVVDAVAEGKRAALGIHEFLGGAPAPALTQPSRLGVSGKSSGAGLDSPLRLAELEAQYEGDDAPEERHRG